MEQNKEPFISKKLLSTQGFTLKPEKLSGAQTAIFAAVILISIAVKIYLIPFNMMDMGDSATRVWNALWWSQKPFFVLPESGHPLWFYFMGPILKISGELFYTSAVTMIILMTIACIYVFKLTLALTDFKTALFAFLIAVLNPVIFRLNFEPYAQQTYLAAACIMLYYFIKALAADKSTKYYIIAGIFSFIALASRPEAIFVIVPMSLLAFLTRKHGTWWYISLSLLFQVIWIGISYSVYGEPFKTINSADQYTDTINIQGLSLGLRAKGFFLPYYFLAFGLTIILFWYFIKGIIFFYRSSPKIVLISLLLPLFAPALVNGAAGAKSTIYHTTHYLYLMFLIAPVITAAGLSSGLDKIRSGVLQYSIAAVIIFTCIPLSYIKEWVPEKYNKLFPKVIEFIVTADEPEETEKLIYVVDNYIDKYPALMFDADDNASSIFYVPYRTKLAPPEKVLISGYNIPTDKDGLTAEIKSFMKKNPKGLIMYRKNPNTIMNRVFSELTAKRPYVRNDIKLLMETEKWIVLTYEPATDTE